MADLREFFAGMAESKHPDVVGKPLDSSRRDRFREEPEADHDGFIPRKRDTSSRDS